MKRNRKYLFTVGIGVLSLFVAFMLELVEAHEKHPGRAERVKQVAKRGDSRMTLSVAGHTTDYALHHFNLHDLVAPSDIERSGEAMYEFLKWKLGNPSAVAAQYISTGYGHFEKAYGDEAGAALMGFELPKEGGRPDFYFPTQLLNLGLQIEEAMVPIAAKAIEAEFAIPAFITTPLLKAYVKEKYKVLGRVGFNIPQKYDFSNELLMLAIDAKRDPNGTRTKLQRVINTAAKK